jgi:thiol-disulfide isomerase/thioredoxin
MNVRIRSAAVAGICAWAATGLAAAVAVGDVFPMAAAANLSAGTLPGTSGSVVLVDFWASWCAPCKDSFASYGRLAADLGPKGLVILAIGVDQDPAAYASFVKKMHPSFFVAWDRDQKLVAQVAVPTMPTCYLLDRRGRVRFVHPGFHGADTEELIRRELETLMAEKAS